MQLSLSGALQSREATQKLRMFSKQWEPGSKLRTYYRTYEDPNTGTRQLLAGACWGHKVNDMKGLGLKTTFIPSLCEYDENGDPVGAPDILNRFSRLAPMFIEGQKKHRIEEIEAKVYPNETLRRENIKQVEDEYDVKNNRQAIKPVISRPTILITVEVLVVPFKDDRPQMDAAVVACQPISNKTAKRLDTILHDKKYAGVDSEGFLEVEWAFPMDTDKGASGAAVVPVGLDSKYAFWEQFPEDYVQLKALYAGVAEDSDMVRRRATSGVAEAAIRQAIINYSFLHSTELEYCMSDETLTDGVMRSVDLIKELDVARAIKDPVFTERYNAALQEVVTTDLPRPIETAEQPAQETPIPEVAPAENQTASVPTAAPAQEAPTINSLLAQQASVGAGESMDDVLDSVDLGAFATEQ